MSVPFFDLARQYETLKDDLLPLVEKVMSSGYYVGGKYVTQFENDLKAYLGVCDAVGVGCATDGLELILRALNIGMGDEVIVPAFTWISDAEVVSLVGAKVKFVDVLPDELTINPEALKAAISPSTKAVIAVHLYGKACHMHEIKQICEGQGVVLIEDCAQSIGTMYHGEKVGSIGDVAAFSFYPTKNLGAMGDGGAVVSNNKEIVEKVRLLANHGQVVRDEHVVEGGNSRLDALQAAILSLKLPHLESWNRRRREVASKYIAAFEGVEAIRCLKQDVGDTYHVFAIQVNERDRLRAFLAEKGVNTAIHYPKDLPSMDFYKNATNQCAVALSASKNVLSLPIFPELTDEEVETVINAISEFYLRK